MKIVVTLFGFDPGTMSRDEKFRIETTRSDMINADMGTILNFVEERYLGLPFEMLGNGVLNFIAHEDQLDKRTLQEFREIITFAVKFLDS